MALQNCRNGIMEAFMSETGRHPISEVMGITMQKVKEMIDSNTIVGEPIRADGLHWFLYRKSALVWFRRFRFWKK